MTKSTNTIEKIETTMTFAERLRTARDGLKYSRSELADRTGIPMKTIEKYEAGTSVTAPSIETDESQYRTVRTDWFHVAEQRQPDPHETV